MFNIKKLKLAMLIPLFLTPMTFANDSTVADVESGKEADVAVVEKPLTKSQKARILLDEKKRLRKIVHRREETDEISLHNYYINELKVEPLTKALLRENTFYIKEFSKEETTQEDIAKESENYLWNIFCLSNMLSAEQYMVTFSTLNSMILDTPEKEQVFKKSNSSISKELSKMDKISLEEIKVRCIDVYGKN